ncbi:SEH-associated protein 4 [Diplogelasinospora grovesii]|uniref:SEH-associated protein 4 n=1 Tax=Diplogelasinospora grovesii TaxID=303347 RepID=A0AAN6NGE9_9PEZI|nr:SEH-associated protein 4 [Diplogelasinospora grovesii]
MGDRPEPGLIKWSPNAAHDSFLHINLQHRILQLYQPTGRARRGRFDFAKVAKHDDFPPLTTYDWSPSMPGLVAVGTSTGVVNLLRVDDGSNAYLELGLKMSRTCQAVAFNMSGKLAVALDRVRSDNCLYIWDVNRLSSSMMSAASLADGAVSKGFPSDMEPFTEPADRREPSVSVSSVRFFEDNPNILVAGIKGQGLRIHDLREQGHHGSAIHFPTKCCNNLAIDYADPNYFASSALDQPGIMVWDRRCTQRQDASSAYLEAVDRDNLPWGGALRLDRAMQMEADPALMDSKNSLIRSLRFSRDHRGMLAVLSRTGQLRVLSTKHEYVEPDATLEGSPELLEVRRSCEVDPHYAESGRKNDKIVSFDWVTLGSPVLQPRMLVLRANGAFEVLEKPSFTSEYPFKLIPWQPPHRGLEEGGAYHAAMEFEPSQSSDILAPLLTETALSDIALFGQDKANVKLLADKALHSSASDDLVADIDQNTDLPRSFLEATSIAEKLAALRSASEEMDSGADNSAYSHLGTELASQRERHEKLLSQTRLRGHFPREAQAVLDHTMLLRAKENYLFNYRKNQQIVADDPWLRDIWGWVAGAEEAASDGGMMSHPLDVGYLGVYTIWSNNLGSKPHARLSDNAAPPDESGWERCLNAISKKLGISKFDSTETKRPHHRELCLEICNWGRPSDPDFDDGRSSISSLRRRDSTWHTMTAAHALFRGETKEAVQILMKASSEHPELLFVGFALQFSGRDENSAPKEPLNFDARVASKTDPYLLAISTFILTGDWTEIANQRSLPLRDRTYVAVRNFSDDKLTSWLEREVGVAIETGDIEGIVLTGISDSLVDILARYVMKFNDFQTATLLLSICSPRFIDDVRARAFRSAYRAYLQRHHAFFLRAKFDVESTKRSKHRGRPTLPPPQRQIALRCVYCDAETTLANMPGGHAGVGPGSSPLAAGPQQQQQQQQQRGGGGGAGVGGVEQQTVIGGGNPFTEKMVAGGISCPNCKRHLPRCVVCLEIVGMPRNSQTQNDRRGSGGWGDQGRGKLAASRFPTFCLKCNHVLHLDHARQWFARHQECPVPECRCKCNFRANPELNYH